VPNKLLDYSVFFRFLDRKVNGLFGAGPSGSQAIGISSVNVKNYGLTLIPIGLP